MRLSVIIPTVGRDTLEAAKASCAEADEIIVVEDATGDHGYTARSKGIRQATGTHLAFLDDDDVYTDQAVSLMRQAACDVPVIFRMDHPRHGILWRDRTLEFGNVGTPMMVVPNVPDKLGMWEPYAPGMPEPGGDYTFLQGCVNMMGDPVWRDEIVAVIRPQDRSPSVTVVTPWWQHPELAPDYQQAVFAAAPDQVIVVDNGGAPELPLLPRLHTVEMGWNSGFSHACNVGLEAATTDAVLFLNNDIVAAGPDWLRPLRQALEPGVLVGANIRNDPHAHVDGIPLPYIDGWCLAGMRDDLLDLEGFDEGYDEPAYYSDNDLCLRARAAGMTLREVRVGLRHKLNVTAGHGADVVAASTANRQRFHDLAHALLVGA